MNDRLLSYLLGQLSAAEVRALEAELATNPELALQLELHTRALAPLNEGDIPEPPAGLADRTLAFVLARVEQPLPAAPTRPLRTGDVPLRPRSRWIDWVLAASLLILVGGLATIAVNQAWNQSQIRSCQQNLATLWAALVQYGQNHNGSLPTIQDTPGVQSMAGVYVPMLFQSGVVTEPLDVGCPARGKKPASATTLTELDRLYQSSPEQLRQRMRDLAGDYAYTLGYREDGKLKGLNLGTNEGVPLLADGPSGDGFGNSPNHGLRGQNVLFVGGNVRWQPTSALGPQCEEIYQNRQRQIRAGLDLSDFVLGAGDAVAGP